LQHILGNQAVQRLLQTHDEELKAEWTASTLSPFRYDFSRLPIHPPTEATIQTKLAINKPGDEYEQEADRIADQEMATPAYTAVSGAPPHIQSFAGQSNGRMDTAPASVEQALASPGRPLEPALRQDMEQRFGYDFSQVRVHSGSAAAKSAWMMNARAYTFGPNIVFGAGQLTPGTRDGRRLIAHELTHVVQQSGKGGMSVAVQRAPMTEAEALRALAEAQRDYQTKIGVAQDYIESKGGKPGKQPGRPSVDQPPPGARRLPSRDWLNKRLIEIAAGGDSKARDVMDDLADASAKVRQAQRDLTAARGSAKTPSGTTTRFKAPTTSKTPTTKTPVKEPPIAIPTVKQLPAPGPAPAPAPVVKRSPSPVTARDVAAELYHNEATAQRMAKAAKFMRWGLAAWHALTTLTDAIKAFNYSAATLAHGNPFWKEIDQAREWEKKGLEVQDYYNTLDLRKGMPSAKDAEWDSPSDLYQFQINFMLTERHLHDALKEIKEIRAGLQSQSDDLGDAMAHYVTAAVVFPTTSLVYGKMMLFADAAKQMRQSLEKADAVYLDAQKAIEWQQRFAQAAGSTLEQRLRQLNSQGIFHDLDTEDLRKLPLAKFTIRGD